MTSGRSAPAVLGSLGLALCLLASACRARGADPAPRPPAGQVWLTDEQVARAGLVVEPVRERPVGAQVLTSGTVTFDDERMTHVSSPVTGRVARIEAELGARVRKGDPLALIVSPDVGSTSSDLMKAEADLSSARREAQRQRELYQAHAGAQRDYEAAQAAYERAQAEYQRARRKAQLLPASAPVGQGYTLRAPIDGEVVARTISPGMEVQGLYTGGAVAGLFTVGELDSVWVVADVYERDLGRVKVGAPARITVVAYPGRIFEGRADWLSPTLDPATRTAKLRCRVANPDHALKPEMFATVAIAAEPRQALAVARAAVLRLGDQTVVFVDGGRGPNQVRRFDRRPVEVTDPGGPFLPIARGLVAGERVVVSGAILLGGML